MEKGQAPTLSVRKDKFLVAPDLSLIICLHYFKFMITTRFKT